MDTTPAGDGYLTPQTLAGGGWQKTPIGSWFFYQPSPAGVNAFDYVEQNPFLFDKIKCFDPLA